MYATPADMIAAFGEVQMRTLTDTDEIANGAVNEDRLQQAINDASGLIDGYLAGQYQTPLATVPAAVKTHTLNWARYLLMSGTPDDRAVADQKSAEAFFTKVGTGALKLFAPAQAVTPASSGPSVQFASTPSVFGRGSY